MPDSHRFSVFVSMYTSIDHAFPRRRETQWSLAFRARGNGADSGYRCRRRSTGRRVQAGSEADLDNRSVESFADAVARLIEGTRIDCTVDGRASKILIDGIDPSADLSNDRVNAEVSLVSSVPRLREVLVEKMRGYARDRDVVMEGRDIGSVVFPETPYKFYIDASPEVRLRRKLRKARTRSLA